MYTGLSLMNEQELAEVTRMIGVDQPPSSKDILFDIVAGWIARVVNKEGRAREEVERTVLEFTAKQWRIIVPDGTDTNDLERSLRLKMANEASDFLSPGWALCCSLIAVGKRANIQEKLDLMMEAASTAVPSQKARKAKRAEWDELCTRWSQTDPAPELDKYIEDLMDRPELHTECLTLGLALSLLDGSIGFPTERLYRDICDRLELGRGSSDEIKAKVNDLYWKHHNAAMPTQTNEGAPAQDPVRSATAKTVYDAGALEALVAEARQQLFASVSPQQPKKSGWSKLVGGLSGMSPFFNNKMKDYNHANLARVVYHTILKQHDAVVVAARLAHARLEGLITDKAPPAPMPKPKPKPTKPPEPKPDVASENAPPSQETSTEPEAPPANQAKPVALSDQMVDVAQNPKRIIKLDL